MKLMNRSIKPVVILSGLLLAMPMAAVADKPDAGAKGGKPNKNSVAVTAACTLGNDRAQVCSCKGLSNVVLWCGDTWVKHEDFGTDGSEVYSATVGCVDSEGNAIDGSINMIAIKSGSQKNANEGAPSGSGLVTEPEACSTDFACPAPGDCTGGEEPPGGDTPDDEDPPIMG